MTYLICMNWYNSRELYVCMVCKVHIMSDNYGVYMCMVYIILCMLTISVSIHVHICTGDIAWPHIIQLGNKSYFSPINSEDIHDPVNAAYMGGLNHVIL